MEPRTNKAAQRDHLPLRLVWVDCHYPVLALTLERALEAAARVHRGPDPPAGGRPSCVICCPESREHAASEVERIRALAPDAAVLVFGHSPDIGFARAAMRAGAQGFVHAGLSPEQLSRAVEVASAGETVLPRGLLEGLVVEGRGPDLSVLRPRQREILELAAEGLSNSQIAQRLYLSESTVKQHLRATYKILGVKNRRQAAYALRRRA